MNQLARFKENAHGKDFVVGDIHFKIRDLDKGLSALGFDKTKDRLFGVGDLIDRGTDVLEGLKLLGESWFFAVKGNHEQMLIDAFRQYPNARYSANGAGWWSTIADESKTMVINRLDQLPTVIEIESAKGIIGIVHADVPRSMPWDQFIQNLDDPKVAETALWGRERITKLDLEGVQGVWRLCTGHTWVPHPLRLSNVLALDCTGGGEGALAIYCIQDDTIYVKGRPVAMERAKVIGDQLQTLGQTLKKLDTFVQGNQLIEAQQICSESRKQFGLLASACTGMDDDTALSLVFINCLHSFSLKAEKDRGAELAQLLAQFEGSTYQGILKRLFS